MRNFRRFLEGVWVSLLIAAAVLGLAQLTGCAATKGEFCRTVRSPGARDAAGCAYRAPVAARAVDQAAFEHRIRERRVVADRWSRTY